MSNPYLEKIASLGDRDYQLAIATANKHREAHGKPKLDHRDELLKEEFRKHRGVAGRVVGTTLGTPLAPIGWVGGYYLGKSHDNKVAGKSFGELKKTED